MVVRLGTQESCVSTVRLKIHWQSYPWSIDSEGEGRDRGRQTDRQRQADRQTNRLRHSDRQTESDRESHSFYVVVNNPTIIYGSFSEK